MHSLLYGFMQFLYDGKAVSYPQSIKEISYPYLSFSLSLCAHTMQLLLNSYKPP